MSTVKLVASLGDCQSDAYPFPPLVTPDRVWEDCALLFHSSYRGFFNFFYHPTLHTDWPENCPTQQLEQNSQLTLMLSTSAVGRSAPLIRDSQSASTNTRFWRQNGENTR